jgi:hypothetical protein
MRRKAVALVILLLVIALNASAVKGQPPPPRLIADNRTNYYVDILAWNGNGWNFIVRLNPRAWTEFPNAQNNSLWRAVIGQVTRDHQVRYVYDPSSGRYQDVWLIQ